MLEDAFEFFIGIDVESLYCYQLLILSQNLQRILILKDKALTNIVDIWFK
jgi:hypothetical protein